MRRRDRRLRPSPSTLTPKAASKAVQGAAGLGASVSGNRAIGWVGVTTAVFVATVAVFVAATAVSVAAIAVFVATVAVFVAAIAVSVAATAVFVAAIAVFVAATAVFVATTGVSTITIAVLVAAIAVFVGAGTAVFVGDGTAVFVGAGTAVFVGALVFVGAGTAVFVGDGTTVFVGDGTAVFVGDGTTVFVGDGTAVFVAAGGAQGPVRELVFNVTEPVWAKARPFKLAPASRLIDVDARTLPTNDVFVPSVVELTSRHHTLHGSPPTTRAVPEVIRSDADLKIQTPTPVRFSNPDNLKADAQ